MGMHSDEARAGIVLCVDCGSKKYAGIMNTVYDSRATVTTRQRSLKIYLCYDRGFGYVHTTYSMQSNFMLNSQLI